MLALQIVFTPSVTVVKNEVNAEEKSISELIIEYSAKHKIDSAKALNIACAESCYTNSDGDIAFNPSAKNPNSSAKGIYQFINGTWKKLCSGDVLDPEDNVKCGTRLLALKNGIKHWEDSKNKGFGGGWSRKPYDRFEVVN